MAIGVLKEIKEAEAAAENIRLQALAESKEKIKNAKDKADKDLDAAAQEAEKIISTTISQKEEEAKKKAEEILKSSEKDCEAIRKVSKDRIERAVNLVIERIVRLNGGS